MKAYFLNPPYVPHFGRGMRWQDTGRGGTLYYPVLLSYATGVVEQEYETRLVDAPAWGWGRQQVVEDVRRFQPDLIVMDSSYPSLNNDIAVGETLKEHFPDVTIVLVGPPASQLPERILASKGIDIVARWEYDFTVKEIADVLAGKGRLEDVKGISYKANGQVVHNPNREFLGTEELDSIPFVSQVYKRHLNFRHYFMSHVLYPHIQIFSARGCPYLCTFCCWPQTLTGRKYRPRSIPNAVDELEWIQRNLPEIKEIFFEDDTFTADKKRTFAFCEEYIRRGLTIPWTAQVRGDLDYPILKKMKDAGCRMIVIGYESGSNEILRNIKKGMSLERLRRCTIDARRAGLLIEGDVIIGLPGETWETIQATKRLIKEVKPDILQVAVAAAYPGTEFYQWAKENGYLLSEDPEAHLDEAGHQRAVVSYPELSAEEMVKEVDKTLRSYYLSPAYVPVALRQVFRRGGWQEVKRIWMAGWKFMRYILSR
jgi:radical SAM superfamily enzyme YgiQ (UPF0313 family)